MVARDGLARAKDGTRLRTPPAGGRLAVQLIQHPDSPYSGRSERLWAMGELLLPLREGSDEIEGLSRRCPGVQARDGQARLGRLQATLETAVGEESVDRQSEVLMNPESSGLLVVVKRSRQKFGQALQARPPRPWHVKGSPLGTRARCRPSLSRGRALVTRNPCLCRWRPRNRVTANGFFCSSFFQGACLTTPKYAVRRACREPCGALDLGSAGGPRAGQIKQSHRYND